MADPGRPIIAAAVKPRRLRRPDAPSSRRHRRLPPARQAAASSPIRSSPLGPLDGEMVANLHAAGVPFLMGVARTMGALKQLPRRQEFAARAAAKVLGRTIESRRRAMQRPRFSRPAPGAGGQRGCRSWRRPWRPPEAAAVAAHARGSPSRSRSRRKRPGLLHKSDLGCVRLGLRDRKPRSRPATGGVANAKARRASATPTC